MGSGASDLSERWADLAQTAALGSESETFSDPPMKQLTQSETEPERGYLPTNKPSTSALGLAYSTSFDR